MQEPYILDCHVDSIQRVVDDSADLARGIPEGHLDLDRLSKAGVRILFFSLWPSMDYVPDGSYERVLALAAAVHDQAARHADRMAIAETMADAQAVVASGRLAAMLGVEGGHAIEEDLGKLASLRDLGVRYMTLTWNNHLSWAESCQARVDGAPNGLTDFGRKVVLEMYRLGITVDCSHVSEQTLADVLAMDVPPPICSHSAARAVHDHCRNLSDVQIEALAEKGAAIGLVLCPAFLAHAQSADLAAAVTHAVHILEVGGRDVLGIGSDFDGIEVAPHGLEDCTKLRKLVTEIADVTSANSAEIDAIAHGNLLRVFEAWE